MAFQSSLSLVLLMISLLGDYFLVTKLFRLSVHFGRFLPLLFVPQSFHSFGMYRLKTQKSCEQHNRTGPKLEPPKGKLKRRPKQTQCRSVEEELRAAEGNWTELGRTCQPSTLEEHCYAPFNCSPRSLESIVKFILKFFYLFSSIC